MTMQQDASDPTGVRDDSPRGNSEVANARHRKALAAMQLKRDGYAWDQIAESLGYPTGRMALVASEQALAREMKTKESQEFLRRIASDRYERLLRSVWKKATDPAHPEHLAANDRARLMTDAYVKLHGLQAPTEYVVTNPTVADMERWVAQVIQTQQPFFEEDDIFEAEVVSDSEDPPDAISA